MTGTDLLYLVIVMYYYILYGVNGQYPGTASGLETSRDYAENYLIYIKFV